MFPLIKPETNIRKTTEAEELIKANSDPKLELQKRIIESLFLSEENKDKSFFIKDDSEDSVFISYEALEMYRKNSLNISYENGEEKLEISYEQVEYIKIESSETEIREAEPLVIDLNGNGIELTDVRKGEGVEFDITGDGTKEQVSWVSPNDGMIVYDRNGNGTIDSGKELFGDQHGAANGFEELAKFDSDNNGVIDRADDIYNNLQIWQDLNRNGYSEDNELKPIGEYGIDRIDLKKDNSHDIIAGNRVEGYSFFHTARNTGRIGEVFFNYYG